MVEYHFIDKNTLLRFVIRPRAVISASWAVRLGFPA